MKILLAAIAASLALLSSAVADEPDSYGPDWTVCNNIQGNPNALIAACGRLIDRKVLSPKYLSWALTDTGTAWARLNRYDLAVANFQKAIEADPTNYSPYFNMSSLLYRAGRFADALEYQDRGVAQAPDTPNAACFRGQILQAMSRLDEAWDDLGRDLERDPAHDCALYMYTIIAAQRRDPEQAIAALDRAIQAKPDYAEAYHRRGAVYRDLGQYERALADLQQAVQLDPEDPNALFMRGELYRELGRLDAALADDNAGLAVHSDDPVGLIERARVEFLKHDYDAAASDCGRRMSRYPGDRPCAELGWHIAMMAGKFETAAENATTLVTRRVPRGLLYRGAAEYAGGKLDEAARDFTQYTAADPDDPYGVLWLYLADRGLGKGDATQVKPMADRRDAWPNPILRLVAGEISADDVLAAADVPDTEVKRQRQSEADYYLGALAALDGHADAAAKFFQASIDAGRAARDSSLGQLTYKPDNDLERALADAALHGHGL